jgi:four helix bundle protein
VARVQGYRDLVVWQKAMDLVEGVYRVTHGWPKDELYGLTNQIRRAAVSIPANVAEGQGRTGAREFLHHLSIACDSLHELETHLLIARRLSYLDGQQCDSLINQTTEIDRLLHGLIKSLRPAAPVVDGSS